MGASEGSMGRNKLVDVECEPTGVDTDFAIQVLADDGQKYWLPKSEVQVNADDGTVTMPEWLAEDKGLV
jgi:hypothetical protein